MCVRNMFEVMVLIIKVCGETCFKNQYSRTTLKGPSIGYYVMLSIKGM